MAEKDELTKIRLKKKKKKRAKKKRKKEKLSERLQNKIEMEEGEVQKQNHLENSEKVSLKRKKKKKRKREKTASAKLITAEKKKKLAQEEAVELGEEELVGLPRKSRKEQNQEKKSKKEKQKIEKTFREESKKKKKSSSLSSFRSKSPNGNDKSSKRFVPKPKKTDPKFIIFMYVTPAILLVIIGIALMFKDTTPAKPAFDEKADKQKALKLFEEAKKLKRKFYRNGRRKEDAQAALEKYREAQKLLGSIVERHRKNPKLGPADFDPELSEIQRDMHDIHKDMGF